MTGSINMPQMMPPGIKSILANNEEKINSARLLVRLGERGVEGLTDLNKFKALVVIVRIMRVNKLFSEDEVMKIIDGAWISMQERLNKQDEA